MLDLVVDMDQGSFSPSPVYQVLKTASARVGEETDDDSVWGDSHGKSRPDDPGGAAQRS